MILGIDGVPPRRLGVYFFYDQAGIVDDYVIHMIESFVRHVTELVVVCNGLLTVEGRTRLGAIEGVRIIVRPNVGFDVWAYKTALDDRGWADVETFDEAILLNFTIMGPVGSFDEMFTTMNARDVDFWGITVHNGAPFDPWGEMPDGRIPIHLQSHFIAIRKTMLSSPEFQSYWDNMIPIRSYTDAVAKHEALFTSRFADAGFSWDVYVDTRDTIGRTFYPLFNDPVDLIVNRKCPIFKRKSFFAGLPAFLEENDARPPRDLFDYLRDSGAYDVDMLVAHLLRSCHLSDIAHTLGLLDIIPEHAPDASTDLSVAVAIVGSSIASLRRSIARLDRIDAAVIYLLVSGNPEIEDAARALAAAHATKAEVIRVAHWTDALGRLAEHDLVCLLTGDERAEVFPATNGIAADRAQYDCVAISAAYVANVKGRFATNSYLGLLIPPSRIHAWYFGELGNEWRDTFSQVDDWLAKIAPGTPRSENVEPIGPDILSFWFRPTALEPLRVAIEGGLVDLHDPLDADYTDDRAQRLLLPFVAQSAGYVTLQGMPASIAANQLNTSKHYLRTVASTAGLVPNEMFSSLTHRIRVASSVTSSASTGLTASYSAYWGFGGGYRAEEMVSRLYQSSPEHAEALVADFAVPKGVSTVRFDPVDGIGCVCADVRVESDADVSIEPLNASRVAGMDLFATPDPQYEIAGDLRNATWIRVIIGTLAPLAADEVVGRLVEELGRPVEVPVSALRWGRRIGSHLRPARHRPELSS